MKTAVKRRPFGNTGIQVSEVGFGAMNLRMLNTREEAAALVHYVLDQGINLIDTARAYKGVNGSGVEVESEEIVGSVIASRTDIDEPLVIVTKGHGYTPEVFDEDLQTSLKTLGIRKTEKGLFIGSTEIKLVYFFHGIKEDRWETIKERDTIRHAQEVQKQGHFTYLGFSSHYGDSKEIVEALNTGAFQVVELPYNVYQRAVGEDGGTDCLKLAYEKGVGVVNMKAFNGSSMVPMAKIISEVCSISYEDMIRFCLSNPYISTIDAGVRYPEEMMADIRASLKPQMTGEEREALKKTADRISGQFQDTCRECMHCMEKFSCPQGLPFPSILGLHARYSIAKSLDQDTSGYVSQYAGMEGPKADACVACGGCNQWCEYHLDIPKKLKQVQEDFAGQAALV